MLDQNQTIIDRVRDAQNILLVSKRAYNGDDLSSLLAWYNFLRSQNKQVDAVIDSFAIREHYKFLPQWEGVKTGLDKLKKFTIAIGIDRDNLDELNYDARDRELLIHITPKQGFIDYQNIHFRSTEFKYDLVITIGTQDYEALGNLYREHADFFYQIPVINIDVHQLNEQFGDINKVDITKTAVAELSFELMRAINPSLIDKNVATCLLTGILNATRSFRTANVDPNTLQLASDLINIGADRQYIVEQLFHRKSVAMLKLWGRVLARLQADSQYKIVWSAINESDFVRSGASEKDLPGVIEELILTSPQAEIVLIFYAPQYDQTKVYLHSGRHFDSLRLVGEYRPEGDKDLAYFSVNLPFEETREEVLTNLKGKLKNLGLTS
ncbi:MAG: hypothetical protein NUV82_02575 [Candidatus Komeilibacteria bacterium]|nr:hypothetical protein [Candidatus Komeilibacteria bacterium]